MCALHRLFSSTLFSLLAALLVVPASAQVDLSGIWTPRFHEDPPERIPGPEIVDYLGLPINAQARQWADNWSASRVTLPEHQCHVHVAPYIYRGPGASIQGEIDALNLVLTEYYDRVMEPNGDVWLIVKTIVDDPTYLNQPFITSSNFKKIPDASGWHLTPGSAR